MALCIVHLVDTAGARLVRSRSFVARVECLNEDAERDVGLESRVFQLLIRERRRGVPRQPAFDGGALVAVAVRAPAPPHPPARHSGPPRINLRT